MHSNNSKAHSAKVNISLIIILLAFIFRGFFLEYTELVDPTETRYATVAEEMTLSNNWLTPKLPRPEGNIAYLGKPPLHFWLTSISYSLFGIDEWSSRLPSYLAALFILCITYNFSRKYFDPQTASLSVLIGFSSAMFFFLSGASVTDVTLSALITAAIVSSFNALRDFERSKRFFLIACFFTSLAFLTKGPVALILIGLPVLAFATIERNFSFLGKIPWLSCVMLLLLICSPWFILSEINNPGFSRYFFWNENVARYLFKDYGDKYGSGHVEPYGMSWLMLLSAFCPWSLFLIYALAKNGLKRSWSWIKADKARLFCFICAISPALFFTFVRQLHAMYLLPSIPLLSVLTANLLKSVRLNNDSLIYKKSLFLPYAIIWCALIVAGSILEFSSSALVIALILSFVGLLIQTKLEHNFKSDLAFTKQSALIFVSYFVCIAILSPYIDTRRSAEKLVRTVASQNLNNNRKLSISVINHNSYSHYWSSKAGPEEIDREIDIKYFNAEDPAFLNSEYILIKADIKLEKLNAENIFKLLDSNREWKLYQNIKNL